MPLRTEAYGKISTSRAAIMSVDVTEDVAYGMDFNLPTETFCSRFRIGVDAEFNSKYPEPGPKSDEMTTMTRSELLDRIYHFYPRGVHCFDRRHVPPGEPFYDDTEEHRRLVEASNRARAEYPTWKAMIRRLGDRYGLHNLSLHLLAGRTDSAYSAGLWITDKTTLTFHVSLLGPYYGIHLPGIPEEEPVAREVAREIEATYPGYQQIPPELGNEVVPDVAMDGALMGEATIYLCLFSSYWIGF
jgi:hypothetical protein